MQTLAQARQHLEWADGVMIGRAAYENPGCSPEPMRPSGDAPMPRSRHDVLAAFGTPIERHLARGGRLAHLTRHLLGLFQGVPGARVAAISIDARTGTAPAPRRAARGSGEGVARSGGRCIG